MTHCILLWSEMLRLIRKFSLRDFSHPVTQYLLIEHSASIERSEVKETPPPGWKAADGHTELVLYGEDMTNVCYRQENRR